jgi:serine/threonine-protein kinase HipA
MSELIAVLYDQIAGVVDTDKHGDPRLEYDQTWREGTTSHPISLSLPIRHRQHENPAVAAYLWGLLPDNELVLQRWATRFGTTAGSVMGLLANVGEDCAGAIRFVSRSRLPGLPREGDGQVEWLAESDVATRLADLRKDASLGRRPSDEGQFSLAGAQAKTALLRSAKGWGLPAGRTPTTHLLKPPMPDLDGHVENEHFCLCLARELELPAASSTVERFENEKAIVIERYDRLIRDDHVRRVHQEDACQALGVHPTRKYQNEGGPSPLAIVRLLRDHSRSAEEDVWTFVAALAFNWLVAGTDAHAKNYSLLIGAGGKARLAPLYDLASALPYPTIDPRKAKLAMKIGGKYRLADVGTHQWTKLAGELELDVVALRARLHDLATRMADTVSVVLQRVQSEGIEHPILQHLADAIGARARECAQLLE